jgi:hypothetical protein
MQSMKALMYVPARLASVHMDELQQMPSNTSRPIRVQLVLLPPYAEDVTPHTPAQSVMELWHGITVSRHGKHSNSWYTLSGLALTGSAPARQGWWLRGEDARSC